MFVAAAGRARDLPSDFLLLTLFERGAERHKALVRIAAPVAALRLGLSLHRKGRRPLTRAGAPCGAPPRCL